MFDLLSISEYRKHSELNKPNEPNRLNTLYELNKPNELYEPNKHNKLRSDRAGRILDGR